MEKKYKCPKCGNQEEFKVWSYADVMQRLIQGKGKEPDDWSAFDDIGDNITDYVQCDKCDYVLMEHANLLVPNPAPVLTDAIKNKIKKKFLNAKKEKIGVVIDNGKTQELRMMDNISSCKVAHYKAEPQQYHDALRDTNFLDKKARKKVVCFVHNHLHSSAEPSTLDLDKAFWNYSYIIVSKVNNKPVMKWFKISVMRGGNNS